MILQLSSERMNRCLTQDNLCKDCAETYWYPEKVPIVKAGQLHFRLPECHILKLSPWFIAAGSPNPSDMDIFFNHGTPLVVYPCNTVPWNCHNSQWHPNNKDIVPSWV